ncbi:hypothetical protein CEXT_454481 [Caerostris extrusa]|uniref:Uncharacterized protein n=1 Tax=Caerostris extrusa TaxID=172846 RepID=A0AAV4M3W7_CAEEX|nr:hypothetical protein CEXT_454481 [Caerostris extrusa]
MDEENSSAMVDGHRHLWHEVGKLQFWMLGLRIISHRNIIVLKLFETAVSDECNNGLPTEFFAVTVEWRDPGNTRQCSGRWLSPQSV